MLVGICLSGQISSAQDKTAAGVVTSYSLSIEPISGYNTQGYGFRVFYSTYDGIANNDLLGWYNDSISYEAMPTTPGSGTYRTDFAICDDTGSYFNRGTMTFTIPATDSDGNGCPDALQVNKSYDNVGNASSYEYVYNYNGTGSWDYYGTLSPTFTFSRSAGSSVGRIIGSEYDPTTGATSTFSGYFNVEGGTGTAIYNATTRAITFAGNSFSFGTSGTGSSTFTRISDNQVSVAQFNFIASDGSRTVKAFTLNRTGNYYRAYPVELLDGDPSTSYVDFRYCHVEILDNNDTDGDGIPDLSDANSMINQTIAFGALTSKIYGDSAFALTGSASSGLAVSYSSSNTSVATVSGSVVTIVGVGSTTITASQAGNSSYNAATSVSQTLTVNKAAQTITFGALSSKTYGDSSFSITGSASSGLSLSYSSSNTGVATVSGSVVTIVGAGSTTITASQPGNSSYNAATSVSQALTVSKASQTISFTTLPAKTYGDSAFALTASSTSGLSVSYSSSNPSVATVAGSTVTIVAAGTATITATQAGNSNYNPASSVFQNLSVSRATLSSSSITLTAPSSLVYNGSLKSYTASASGVSGFSYTYSGISTTVYPSTTTPPKDVGYYSVTATSTDVNYAGSINGVKFTIIPLPVTVTAAAKTKGYGSLDPVLTYTSSGLLGTDAFTGSLTRAAGEVVGSYNILIGTLSAGSNYSISYVGASLAITANYLSWASSYGLSGNNALQSADPDNDGSNNAYEFAFYGNPLAPGSRSVSASVSTGGIKYVWFQRKDISQVTYTPKTGNDLATAFNTWSTVQSVTSNPQPIGIDSNYEQVEVVLPTSLGKGFLKVQADVR
jgi:hypothetical protein